MSRGRIGPLAVNHQITPTARSTIPKGNYPYMEIIGPNLKLYHLHRLGIRGVEVVVFTQVLNLDKQMQALLHDISLKRHTKLKLLFPAR